MDVAEAIALYRQAMEQGDMEMAQQIRAMLEQMGIDVDEMGSMRQMIQSRLRPGGVP